MSTYSDLFSKRYGLGPSPAGLLYEEVSKRARIGLYHIVDQTFDEQTPILQGKFLRLYKDFCVALRIPRDRKIAFNERASAGIERLIMTCEWWQFYDICQVMWSSLAPSSGREHMATEINTLFREEQLGFELVDGKVEKVGSGFIDAKVKEARYLLKEPEFKGADEHFEKAIKSLNERPNPDVENCVKDAVAAIESVGRVIVSDDKALLDDIIRNAAKKGVIPKPLDQTFQKVYAYRGSEPGVAHGAVATSKVTEAEAELILAMSAAMIIYLVKKRSKFETI